MNKGKTIFADAVATLFYIGAVILIYVGFDKMFNYKNGEGIAQSVNAYVGGDAYNYIINATYAGNYFTLALMCVVVGIAIQMYALLKTKIELENERQAKQGE